MEAIVLTDDELKRFGYGSVPIVAVEKAAETLENPNLPAALPRLRAPWRTIKTFIELLENSGSVLNFRNPW